MANNMKVGIDPTEAIKGAKVVNKSLDSISKESKDMAKDFTKSGRKADNALDKLARSAKVNGAIVSKNLASMGTKFIGLSTIAATAMVAVGTVMVKRSLETNDALAKTADKIGITTEKLKGLQYVAELSGGSILGMNEALTKGAKRLGEFNASGGGAAAKWLEKLNFDTKALAQLSPDELFIKYADAIKGLNSRGEQLAAISALMGDESRNLIGVIDAGSDAIRDATETVEAYGVAISRVDAAKIEAANDAFAELGLVTEGIGNQLTIAMAPYFIALSKGFSGAAKDGKGFTDDIAAGMDSVIYGIGIVGDAWLSWKYIYLNIKQGWLDLQTTLIEGQILLKEVSFQEVPDSLKRSLLEAKNEALQAGQAVADLGLEIATERTPSTKISDWAKRARKDTDDATEAVVKLKKEVAANNGANFVGPIQGSSTAPVDKDKDAKETAADTKEAADAQALSDKKINIALNEMQAKADIRQRARDEEEEANTTDWGKLAQGSANALGDLASAFQTYSNTISQEIRESAAADADVINTKYDDELTALQQLHADKKISDAQYARDKVAINSKRDQALTDLDEATTKKLDSEGKKAFDIGKRLQIAQAIIAGGLAAVQAYAAGVSIGGPYALAAGAAFAAASVLATGAMIHQIASTSYNSSSGMTPPSGGTPTIATPNQETPRGYGDNNTANTQVYLTINGFTNQESVANDVLPALREILDGGETLFSEDSAQVDVIRRAG